MRTKACIHTLTGHTNTVADVRCQAAEPQVNTDDFDVFSIDKKHAPKCTSEP